MTRIKPGWYHKFSLACTAVNEKFNTSVEEPKETTIRELEIRMGNIPLNEKSGIMNFQNLSKTVMKTYKGLRK